MSISRALAAKAAPMGRGPQSPPARAGRCSRTRALAPMRHCVV